MKRDWKVIKAVLEELEPLKISEGMAFSVHYKGDQESTYEEIHKFEMALLLLEQEYIKGFESKSLGVTYKSISNVNLTWKGHDLLDTLNDKKVWNKIKEIAVNKGVDVTFSTLGALQTAAIASILN